MDNEKFQGLVLEHLAKVTQEITEIKIDIKELKLNITEVKQNQVNMENKFDEKIKALFDAYTSNNEQISNLINLPDRVEQLEKDMKIVKKIVSN